jgi:hypothetical protein
MNATCNAKGNSLPTVFMFCHSEIHITPLLNHTPNWTSPFRFSDQFLHEFSIPPTYAGLAIHKILLYFIILTVLVLKFKIHILSLCNFVYSPINLLALTPCFTPRFLAETVQHNTCFR